MSNPIRLSDNDEQWIDLSDGTSLSIQLNPAAVRVNFWNAQHQCVTTNILTRPSAPADASE